MPVISAKRAGKNSRERGSVLVESSLIMTLALMVIIATFDFGQFLFFHQTLSEKVRQAARYGSLNWDRGCDATCVQNMVLYGQAAPPSNLASVVTVPGLKAANVSVTMPNPTTQGWDARVIVTVQNYSFKVFNPWLSPAGSLVARPITASSPIEAPN
jgi:hypothetical protein